VFPDPKNDSDIYPRIRRMQRSTSRIYPDTESEILVHDQIWFLPHLLFPKEKTITYPNSCLVIPPPKFQVPSNQSPLKKLFLFIF